MNKLSKWTKLAYGLGHVHNDIAATICFSFSLLYMQVSKMPFLRQKFINGGQNRATWSKIRGLIRSSSLFFFKKPTHKWIWVELGQGRLSQRLRWLRARDLEPIHAHWMKGCLGYSWFIERKCRSSSSPWTNIRCHLQHFYRCWKW